MCQQDVKITAMKSLYKKLGFQRLDVKYQELLKNVLTDYFKWAWKKAKINVVPSITTPTQKATACYNISTQPQAIVSPPPIALADNTL